MQLHASGQYSTVSNSEYIKLELGLSSSSRRLPSRKRLRRQKGYFPLCRLINRLLQ
jgi:hypothetical protein